LEHGRHTSVSNGRSSLIEDTRLRIGFPATIPCIVAHFIAQDLDLRLERSPELVFLERVVLVLISVTDRFLILVVAVVSPRQFKECCYKRFFQVCEGEVVRDSRNCIAQFAREINALLVLQLLPPVLR
jgi:hypothetical protein